MQKDEYYVHIVGRTQFIDGSPRGIGVDRDEWEALAIAVAMQPQMLNGYELKLLRIELSLTQKQLGKILGYSEHAIGKYEKAVLPINKSPELILRLFYLESRGVPTDSITEMLNRPRISNEGHTWVFHKRDGEWELDGSPQGRGQKLE